MFLLCKDFKRGKFREFVPAPIFFPGILPKKCGNLSTVFNFHYHCCFVIFYSSCCLLRPTSAWTCCRQIVSICPKDRGREREAHKGPCPMPIVLAPLVCRVRSAQAWANVSSWSCEAKWGHGSCGIVSASFTSWT